MEEGERYELTQAVQPKFAMLIKLTPELIERIESGQFHSIRLKFGDGPLCAPVLHIDSDEFRIKSVNENPETYDICRFSDDGDGYVLNQIASVHKKLTVEQELNAKKKEEIRQRQLKAVEDSKSRKVIPLSAPQCIRAIRPTTFVAALPAIASPIRPVAYFRSALGSGVPKSWGESSLATTAASAPLSGGGGSRTAVSRCRVSGGESGTEDALMRNQSDGVGDSGRGGRGGRGGSGGRGWTGGRGRSGGVSGEDGIASSVVPPLASVRRATIHVLAVEFARAEARKADAAVEGQVTGADGRGGFHERQIEDSLERPHGSLTGDEIQARVRVWAGRAESRRCKKLDELVMCALHGRLNAVGGGRGGHSSSAAAPAAAVAAAAAPVDYPAAVRLSRQPRGVRGSARNPDGDVDAAEDETCFYRLTPRVWEEVAAIAGWEGFSVSERHLVRTTAERLLLQTQQSNAALGASATAVPPGTPSGSVDLVTRLPEFGGSAGTSGVIWAIDTDYSGTGVTVPMRPAAVPVRPRSTSVQGAGKRAREPIKGPGQDAGAGDGTAPSVHRPHRTTSRVLRDDSEDGTSSGPRSDDSCSSGESDSGWAKSDRRGIIAGVSGSRRGTKEARRVCCAVSVASEKLLLHAGARRGEAARLAVASAMASELACFDVEKREEVLCELERHFDRDNGLSLVFDHEKDPQLGQRYVRLLGSVERLLLLNELKFLGLQLLPPLHSSNSCSTPMTVRDFFASRAVAIELLRTLWLALHTATKAADADGIYRQLSVSGR